MTTNVCSALISSFIEIIFTHPLDVYKVIYQQNPNYSFSNYMKTNIQFKYRGIIARTFGIIPMRTTFWISQDIAKENIPKYNKYFYYSSVGSFTSFFQTIIDTPIENIKISKINNSRIKKNVKQLYRGFYPNYLRNSIFATSVFTCNELGDTYNINRFISGATGGCIGSLLSQPIDYIKTLQQSGYKITYKEFLFNPYHRSNCMTGWFQRASMSFISMGVGSFMFCFCKQYI